MFYVEEPRNGMLSPATANGHQCIQETTPGSLPSDPELSLVLGGLKSSERKALIQKAVSQFFPLDFPPNAPMDIQRLSGALTNLVFKVTSSLSGQRVLLRVYGTGAEVFVSRSQELAWFIEMSRMGLGPRLLGLFGNGRFEEFLEGVTLTAADLRVPKTFKAIAQALVHLHRLGKPDDSSTIRQNSEMWDRMGSWVKLFESALESLPGHLKERVSQAQLPDVGTLHRDISFLQKSLGPIGTLVFSHNDLQYGNVLSQLPDSGVVLVDYEYAGFNYAEYDIANFFCEWAADYHSAEPHVLHFESKYPTHFEQKAFIRAYTQAHISLGELDSFTNADQEEAFISAFQKRVDRFAICSHLLWGLWGIFRGAAESGSTEDFDYIGYGLNRMAEYQRRRNTLIEPS